MIDDPEKTGTSTDDSESLEEAQEDAAEEREENGGYQ